MPGTDALPAALRELPACQAEFLRPAQLIDDIDHLIARLVEISASAPPEELDQAPPLVMPPSLGAATAYADGERRRMEEHYRMVADHAGSLVVFLGSGANTDDRAEPWQADSGMLPDDQDLARYLASRVGLKDPSPHLAQVAQYAGARYCERDLFDWVTQAFRADSSPSPVHNTSRSCPRCSASATSLS